MAALFRVLQLATIPGSLSIIKWHRQVFKFAPSDLKWLYRLLHAGRAGVWFRERYTVVDLNTHLYGSWDWLTLQGRKSERKSSLMLRRNLVCLIKSEAGTPGGFLETGDNNPHSSNYFFPWQLKMLLSIWELVSIMSLVYLSLISEFSFLLECRLEACQQELKSTFRTKEKCVCFFPPFISFVQLLCQSDVHTSWIFVS